MLKIRPEQMAAFQAVAETAFIKRVAAYLREGHAEAEIRLPSGSFQLGQIPDETLIAMVKRGVAKAREYGMRQESALSAYVVLMVETAPNFDAHPLIRHLLKDEQTPPDGRLERLLQIISEQNWEAVKENSDAAAWGTEAEEK